MSIASRLFSYLHTQADSEYRRGILSFLEHDSDAKLLDCGCSDSTFTHRLAEIIGTKHVYGVKVIDTSITHAQETAINVTRSDLYGIFPC